MKLPIYCSLGWRGWWDVLRYQAPVSRRLGPARRKSETCATLGEVSLWIDATSRVARCLPVPSSVHIKWVKQPRTQQ